MIDKHIKHLAIKVYKSFFKMMEVQPYVAFWSTNRVLHMLQKLVAVLILINGICIVMFTTMAFKGQPREGMEYAEPMLQGLLIVLDLYFLALIVRFHLVFAMIRKMLIRIEQKYNAV